MKLFRKVMSGLLAGSLILSLVACGAGSGATETGDPSGNGAVGTSSASGDEIVVNVSDNVTLINLEVYANNNSCEFLYADLVFDPLCGIGRHRAGWIDSEKGDLSSGGTGRGHRSH